MKARWKIVFVLTIVVLAMIGCTGRTSMNEAKKKDMIKIIPLKGFPKTQKDTEGQLRYATYKIWNGFIEGYQYSFTVENEVKDIYYDIHINLYKNSKEKDVLKDRLEEILKKNEIVVEGTHQDMLINKTPATLVPLTYKENKDFDDEKLEYVLLQSDNDVILITCHGFLEFFENGRAIWESLYQSFTTDVSQSYKLTFGSFTPPDGMIDNSSFHYSTADSESYDIQIEYVNDSEERKKNNVNTLKALMVSMFSDKTLKINKDKNITVDEKKAHYLEFTITPKEKDKQTEKGVAFLMVDDLQPGLEITVTSANPELFELYRGKMQDFLASLKFN